MLSSWGGPVVGAEGVSNADDCDVTDRLLPACDGGGGAETWMCTFGAVSTLSPIEDLTARNNDLDTGLPQECNVRAGDGVCMVKGQGG